MKIVFFPLYYFHRYLSKIINFIVFKIIIYFAFQNVLLDKILMNT